MKKTVSGNLITIKSEDGMSLKINDRITNIISISKHDELILNDIYEITDEEAELFIEKLEKIQKEKEEYEIKKILEDIESKEDKR